MLLTDCKHHFNTDNLYDILCVERTATASELKKGYYKQSMKWHPDKAGVDEDSRMVATAKFQILTKAYEILSDKERRGTIDEENLSIVDSINAWRRLFKKVTLEDVEKFCAQYKGSEEEEKDVIAAYNSWKGDMSKIMQHVCVVAFDEEDRIKEGGGSLEQIIHQRQLVRSSDTDAYLDSLASKYCTKKKRAKK
ncbi:unnamed protein product [Angiostrongylus costaricensis]|uniref:J domain-containing protein n=1 Tax=Angiostrongylus costaricensis TaxID=334426 RepID=A0A0R3PMG5_ANGCS|nr:unnamed protein product [Angiostrongylus costaricensis]